MSEKPSRKIVLTGGGTLGHVTPHLALIPRLLEKGYETYIDSPTNQQFVVLDDDRMKLLKDKIRFSFWEKLDEDHTVIRFVTSWSTTEEDMQALEEALEVI